MISSFSIHFAAVASPPETKVLIFCSIILRIFLDLGHRISCSGHKESYLDASSSSSSSTNVKKILIDLVVKGK